jgi:hypothetical protein
MGYRSAADGINQKGKTKGKNLGDTGSNVGLEKGKKISKAPNGGKTNEDMLSMGRGMAKIKANGC